MENLAAWFHVQLTSSAEAFTGIGPWVDSSEQTAEETVEDILQQLYSSSL